MIDKNPARGGKAVVKKKEETKFDYVVLDNITRCGLLGTGLRVHDLNDQFSPGQFSGFPAKMNYSASPCVLARSTCSFHCSMLKSLIAVVRLALRRS